MMKKVFLLLTLCATVLISCDDDDATTNTPTPSIIGNYTLQDLDANIAVDLDGDMTSSTDITSEAPCVLNMALSFNTNGNFNSTIVEVSYDANNMLVCTTTTQSGTYTINGSTLALTFPINGGTATDTLNVQLTTNEVSFVLDDAAVSQYFSNTAGTPASGITQLDFTYRRI